jgi:hypothetical protein
MKMKLILNNFWFIYFREIQNPKKILSLIGKKQAFLVVYLVACHTMTNTRVFEIKGKY